MDAENSGNTNCYWVVEKNDQTGAQQITVAAHITFRLGKGGELLREPQLIVAGGQVAVGDLVTVADVLDRATEAYDYLPEDGVVVVPAQSTVNPDSQIPRVA